MWCQDTEGAKLQNDFGYLERYCHDDLLNNRKKDNSNFLISLKCIIQTFQIIVHMENKSFWAKMLSFIKVECSGASKKQNKTDLYLKLVSYFWNFWKWHFWHVCCFCKWQNRLLWNNYVLEYVVRENLQKYNMVLLAVQSVKLLFY